MSGISGIFCVVADEDCIILPLENVVAGSVIWV